MSSFEARRPRVTARLVGAVFAALLTLCWGVAAASADRSLNSSTGGAGGDASQIPPYVSGPPLGIKAATYKHKYLHLTVSVPAAGKLHVRIPATGRHKLAVVRRARHAGRVAITAKIYRPHWTTFHRITIDLVLHAPIGFFTRTQTVGVRFI